MTDSLISRLANARAAVAAEREACARLCESRQDYEEEARAISAASKALNDWDADIQKRNAAPLPKEQT